MKIRLGIYFVFVGISVMVACKKNDGPPTPENGIYRGVFNRIYEGDDTSGSGVVFLAMNDYDSTFSLQGDTSSNTPFSCNGTFSFAEKGKIIFENTAYIVPGLWDPYYILDTTWTYTYTDTSFVVKLDLEDVRYEYALSRY